jgi:hypothetical protein
LVVEPQNKNLEVGSSNLSGRASFRDIPCESHGIHTAKKHTAADITRSFDRTEWPTYCVHSCAHPCRGKGASGEPPPLRKGTVQVATRGDKKIAKPSAAVRPDIERELTEVKAAWQRYRSTHDRNAVYYLEAVFALVRRWQCLQCALKNSRAALRLKPRAPKMKPEPFARVLFCTADVDVADAKTRSKWSRVLRFARKAKPDDQRLTDFIKSNGGINKCAGRFASRC